MPKISVRQTHPRLYVGVLGYGLWGIFVGLAMLLTPSFVPYDISPALIAVPYMVFGVMKIYGVTNLDRYGIAKLGMNLCISLTILVGIGLLLEYLSGERSQSLYLILGFVFAGGFIQVAPAQEPPVNPATRVRGNG